MSVVTKQRRIGGRHHLFWLGTTALAVAWCFTMRGADLKEAQQQWLTGNYTQCVALATEALRGQPDNEDWNLLLTRALLDTGRYPEALTTITNALEQRGWSIRLRWLAREVFLSNGRTNAAAKALAEIVPLVGRNPSDYRDSLNLV